MYIDELSIYPTAAVPTTDEKADKYFLASEAAVFAALVNDETKVLEEGAETYAYSVTAPEGVTVTYTVGDGDPAETCALAVGENTVTVTFTKGNKIYEKTATITVEEPPIFTVNATGETITGLTVYGQSLTAIEIPETLNGVTITAIGAEAFSLCESLITVSMPDTVTSIGRGAFSYCSNLTTIDLSKTVIEIGSDAFWTCSSLKKIIIPMSVTIIEYQAFACCVSLTIYCEAESKPVGWDEQWNTDPWTVVWGYTGE